MTTPYAEMPSEAVSARRIAEGIRSREHSCVAVAKEALERIEANAALNAFITVNPSLLAHARGLDRRLARGAVGPLHGVPVAIKDNIGTSGMPTTAGAVAFAGLHTGRDAPVVARLREAGALIVGKTNLDELAIAGRGQSGLGGQTLSPHDPDRHPAGSSGGSAVAVATGMAALALGTETVNSLRYPASATGTVAIRPARGTVDRTGVFPQSALCDVVGPMARSVDDAILLLDVLRGRAGSPTMPPAPGTPRIGLVRSMMGDGPEYGGVNAVIEGALERLSEQGGTVIEIDVPDLATASLYERLAVQVFEVAELFETFLSELSERPDVVGLNGVRTLRDVLERGPHAPLVPPFAEAALRGTLVDRTRAIEHRVRAAQETERLLRSLFERERLDAVAYPLCHRPAARPIGEDSRPERNGILASALGWPAIDLPVGMAMEEGKALPVGLDLMGPPEREATLVAIASDIEKGQPRRP